ncbi:MAG: hypothetical protein HOK28_18205 [Deltaproteobacteria bacterium]|nr:hypothetical protein [Deltaproteobacteria bacterium]
MSESPPEPQPTRLRRALQVSTFFAAVVCLLAVGARAYLSDDRLKTMLEERGSEALGQKVSVENLELSLLGGFKLNAFSLGNPDTDSLAVRAKLIELGWAWQNQSTRHVGLQQLNIEGLEIFQKSHAQPAPEPSLEPAAEPSEKPVPFVLPQIPLQQWPMLASLENFNIELKELNLQQGENKVNLKGVFVRGALTLGGGLADANVTIHTHKQLAHLQVKTPSEVHIDGAPNISINLTTRHGSEINLSTVVEIPVHKQMFRFQNETAFSLPLGQLSASLVEFSIDEHSHLKTSAKLTSTYTKPTLETGQLLAQANFQALQPFFDLFEIPVEMTGLAKVKLHPVDLKTLDPEAAKTATLTGLVQLENIHVSSGPNHLQQFNGDIAIHYEDGRLHATSTSLNLSFDNPSISVAYSQFKLSLDTHVDDWVLKSASNQTVFNLQGALSKIKNPEAAIQNLTFELQTQGPTAILRGQVSPSPFTYTLGVQTEAVDQAAASLGPVSVQAQGSFFDINGKSLQTDLDIIASQIELTPIDGPMSIKKLSAHASVRKQANTFKFTQSTLELDTLAKLNLDGTLTLHSSKLVSTKDLKLHADFSDLGALKNRLPPNPALPQELTGSAALHAEVSGTIPIQRLITQATPPPVPKFVTPEQWESDAEPLVDYVGSWMRSLSEGLDLTTIFKADFTNISVTHQGSHVEGFDFHSKFFTGPTGTQTDIEWLAKKVESGASLTNAHGLFEIKIRNDELEITNLVEMDSLAHPSLLSALHHISLTQEAAYRFGKDLNVKNSTFSANGEDLVLEFNGLVYHPIRTVTSGALLEERLPGVKAGLTSSIKINSAKPSQLFPKSPTLRGELTVATNIAVENGELSFKGEMDCTEFTVEDPTMLLSRLNGKIPVEAIFESYQSDQNMSIVRDLGFAGGALYLRTDDLGDEDDDQRQVYYEDLRPYRPQAGLEIGRLKFGDYELNSVTIDARIQNGTLSADHFSTELLGGDVLGNLRIGLNAAREFKGAFSVQASNIDASHFSKLNLEAGPDSELSADMRLGIFVSPSQRDINLDVNVTQIGKKTLDRFLQLLDPEGKNPQIQKTRSNLKIIEIQEVTAWIRHENLNMDLDYRTLLSIPGTDIGFRPIDRELLRRYTLTEQVIDPFFQSYVDRYLSKTLGWNHATP